MRASRYSELFEHPTEFLPNPYQERLAGGNGGLPCESLLIDAPTTGTRKTAAAVLAWLWNRVMLGRDDWPRRLVYFLPMRTLVDQTEREGTNGSRWWHRMPACVSIRQGYRHAAFSIFANSSSGSKHHALRHRND